VLRIVQRVITRFLLKQAGLKGNAADAGSVTLIQRFGSAANLNIHLHCLVLDGVYRSNGDEVVFQEARAPTRDELHGLLERIIVRLMKMLTRQGYLIEQQGMIYLADIGPDNPLKPLQAAACTYRIAFGPRAGQKVLSLRTVAGRDEKASASGLCADAHGFSLHAAVRCAAHQRKRLERLCRYITRPAIANPRLSRNGKGQVVLQLKSAYRDGTTHIVMSPQGIHATPSRPGAASAPAPDPLPRGARPTCQTACSGRPGEGRERARRRAHAATAAHELGAVVEACVRHRY
jgi:hypothetical protein